ncbi:hypothetical protein NXF25_007177 [Crotalus adamanteus]|uniref:Arb2 domain-containing protein n=1 Tax=Crotalus adamanteus TaxID=8729 RepID=A0AAW1C327_CROAD
MEPCRRLRLFSTCPPGHPAREDTTAFSVCSASAFRTGEGGGKGSASKSAKSANFSTPWLDYVASPEPEPGFDIWRNGRGGVSQSKTVRGEAAVRLSVTVFAPPPFPELQLITSRLMHVFIIVLNLLRVWINMAQLQQGGPDEKEKTTALKDLLSRIDLDELMKKDEPPLEFADTLEGFEYTFNEKGQLRHIKTGEPFVFNYREDLHRWNQKRYEALGEIITKYVYELLEEECHLKKVYLPVDAEETEPRSFIFMSEDALINPDKLMILIQGSGVVRAGQWARRLIINEDLDSGTQIPYIKRAIEAVETEDSAIQLLGCSFRDEFPDVNLVSQVTLYWGNGS